MAEYTNNALQTINPGETAIFTATTVPCQRGFVRHVDGEGTFSLSGWVPNNNGCCCHQAKSANYLVQFHANIAVPTGETVGQISVAITVDGATVPSSQMISTPAAVEEFNNVAASKEVPIWRGCCQTVAIRNTSTIPILMQNAAIHFTRPDLTMSY